MPLYRFRLLRQGHEALTTEHRASSPESLAESLALAPEARSWPATLCVFRHTAGPGDAPGHWHPLTDRPVPLWLTGDLLRLCQALWPQAECLGWDYERQAL
jgi:hypothetical protein